jgi:hypothetical protein
VIFLEALIAGTGSDRRFDHVRYHGDAVPMGGEHHLSVQRSAS